MNNTELREVVVEVLATCTGLVLSANTDIVLEATFTKVMAQTGHSLDEIKALGKTPAETSAILADALIKLAGVIRNRAM